MALSPKNDPDWSDSDEGDVRSDVETSVLLGLPDGKIDKQGDLDDAAVSRIGGHPAFLTSAEPSISGSQCKNCSFPMELLVQLWCPFENSPMDRALYLFGCGRGECQHKTGSVRAFRGLRFNASYASKLEKKREREREKEAERLRAKQEEERKKAAAKVNPFSMNADTASSEGLFGAPPAFESGLGTQLFDPSSASQSSKPEDTAEPYDADVEDEEAPPPPESESEPGDSDSELDESSESETGSSKSILAAPTHALSPSSPWRAIPAYTPPLYLSTATEYVPPAPKPPKASISATPASVEQEYDDDDEKVGKSKKAEARRAEKERADAREAKAWESAMGEGYEDSMEVDKVFEKFARVAGYEGGQCIRYELGGTPLPYSNDSIFKSLFPSPSSSLFSSSTPVSPSAKFTPSSSPTSVPARRTYNPKSAIISPCPRCSSPRAFECQLMPHLISILQTSTTSTSSNPDPTSIKNQDPDPEARKRELERLLRVGTNDGGDGTSGTGGGEGGGENKRGMEWGTCLMFSCSQDCSLDLSPHSTSASDQMEEKRKESKELWAEELVLIQWDE